MKHFLTLCNNNAKVQFVSKERFTSSLVFYMLGFNKEILLTYLKSTQTSVGPPNSVNDTQEGWTAPWRNFYYKLFSSHRKKRQQHKPQKFMRNTFTVKLHCSLNLPSRRPPLLFVREKEGWRPVTAFLFGHLFSGDSRLSSVGWMTAAAFRASKHVSDVHSNLHVWGAGSFSDNILHNNWWRRQTPPWPCIAPACCTAAAGDPSCCSYAPQTQRAFLRLLLATCRSQWLVQMPLNIWGKHSHAEKSVHEHDDVWSEFSLTRNELL